jgi:ribose-phosphate pyrophosphokinase
MPLFPYSRQPDLPYRKTGAPLSKSAAEVPRDKYTFESVPSTPGPGTSKSAGLGHGLDLHKMLNKISISGEARGARSHSSSVTSQSGSFTKLEHDNITQGAFSSLEAKPGYKRWVAQAGTLIADLLTCAGADQYVHFP